MIVGEFFNRWRTMLIQNNRKFCWHCYQTQIISGQLIEPSCQHEKTQITITILNDFIEKFLLQPTDDEKKILEDEFLQIELSIKNCCPALSFCKFLILSRDEIEKLERRGLSIKFKIPAKGENLFFVIFNISKTLADVKAYISSLNQAVDKENSWKIYKFQMLEAVEYALEQGVNLKELKICEHKVLFQETQSNLSFLSDNESFFADWEVNCSCHPNVDVLQELGIDFQKARKDIRNSIHSIKKDLVMQAPFTMLIRFHNSSPIIRERNLLNEYLVMSNHQKKDDQIYRNLGEAQIMQMESLLYQRQFICNTCSELLHLCIILIGVKKDERQRDKWPESEINKLAMEFYEIYEGLKSDYDVFRIEAIQSHISHLPAQRSQIPTRFIQNRQADQNFQRRLSTCFEQVGEFFIDRQNQESLLYILRLLKFRCVALFHTNFQTNFTWPKVLFTLKPYLKRFQYQNGLNFSDFELFVTSQISRSTLEKLTSHILALPQ